MEPRKGNPFGVYQNGVQTVPLKEDIMRQVWHLYQNNPTMQACRSVLFGVLFSGQFDIFHDGEPVELTAEFQEFLVREWLPFARDAADCLRTFGFVPYVIVDADDGVNRVPIVPPLGAYGVEYTIDESFRRRMLMRARLSATTHEVADSDFFVQCWPNMQGEICSPMMALAAGIVRTDVMTAAAVECEINAARPTLITQSHRESRTSASSGGNQDRAVISGVAEWLNRDATALSSRHKLTVDEDAMNRIHTARETAWAHNRAAMASVADPANAAMGSAHSAAVPGAALKGSVLPLPEGQEYVNATQPRSGQPLVEITRLTEDQICAMMGVPNSLIHPASSQYNSGALVQRMVNTELYRLAEQLSGLMTRVYERIYGDAAPGDATARAPAPAKTRKRTRSASRAGGHAVQVKLRHPTFTDPDLIVGIAERTQLFKNEYTAELVARAAGFWDETETDRFIRTEQQLITGQRSQLAYENGLQMKLQKASAAARAASAEPARGPALVAKKSKE